MARDQQRSSTFIDPASLQTRPTNQHVNSFGSQNTQKGLARHPSVTIKPLLNFDGEDEKLQQPSPTANRLPNSRSVFGVDTLWQREMAKLKEIQGAEERENVERLKREEDAEKKKQKKKQRKKKKGGQNTSLVEVIDETQKPRIPAEPPTLPNIQRASRRAPPKPSESDISSESEDSLLQTQERESNVWYSSDEEATGPRRTTGTGPRYPNQSRKAFPRADEDSEEDLPLAATVHKAAARAAFSNSQRHSLGSDDEDRPLSHVLKAKPGTSATQGRNNTFVDPQGKSDDDDEPLGLRVSKTNLYPSQEDEDDTPLAFHPEQQRRTQYQLLAQQQQHQQQLLMQAQLQSNMMMNLTPGYYPQPMLNPMAMLQMQAPIPIPSPPPIHDEAKYGRVDRWRRDVVVDRENV